MDTSRYVMAKEKGFISTALAVVLGVAGGYAVIKHWEPIKEFAVNAYAEISTSIKDWLDKDTTTPDTDLDINGGTNEDTDIDTPVSTKIQISLTDEQVARIDAGDSFYMIDGVEYATIDEYREHETTTYNLYRTSGDMVCRWFFRVFMNWDEVPHSCVAYTLKMTIDGVEYTINCTRAGSASFNYDVTPDNLKSFTLHGGTDSFLYVSVELPGTFRTYSIDSITDWNNQVIYENA